LLGDALVRLLRDLLHLVAQLFELGAERLFVSDKVLNGRELFFDPFGHLGADLIGLAGCIFLDTLEACARLLSLLVSELLEKFQSFLRFFFFELKLEKFGFHLGGVRGAGEKSIEGGGDVSGVFQVLGYL
jgi:hypothetical protein